MRNFTPTTWICLAGLALVLGFAVFGEDAVARWMEDKSAEIEEGENVPGADLMRLSLPAAPERALVEQYCQTCHHLSRVQKAGGTVEGWTSRIERMIKNGATIPPADVPAVAAYLASALPIREHESP